MSSLPKRQKVDETSPTLNLAVQGMNEEKMGTLLHEK